MTGGGGFVTIILTRAVTVIAVIRYVVVTQRGAGELYVGVFLSFIHLFTLSDF